MCTPIVCVILYFSLTLLKSSLLISYLASVVIPMNTGHIMEVCLNGPALTHVQSIFLPALSYKLCSYTFNCFQFSILSEKKTMFTNFKCHIICKECFMLNLANIIGKSQIPVGFQHFCQLYNFYQPFLNSMVIQILKLLIEWHITSFARKIVFQILHLHLLCNTYHKHDFIAAVMKLMNTMYTSDIYFCPSLLMCYLNHYLFF